jgi:putative transposase
MQTTMAATSLRKTYKYQLKPTPAQERVLDGIVWASRRLYNTALEHRIFLYRQRGVTLSRYQQEAELKDLRAALPEYAAIHSHVLQDVLARLDKTYQAFFRRVRAGQTPGFPRFQGRGRFNSFVYKEYDNGARLDEILDNGFLVLSKIGRIAVRWSRPIEGAPKTVPISREAEGWYVALSGADAPMQPLEPTGQETGIDVG